MMPFSRFKMFLEAVLMGLFLSTPILASAFMPRTASISNATSTFTKDIPSPTPSKCCFVVQDTITENWWEEYTTVTYYQTVNATYITTLVTPYIDTTVTNIMTRVESINATLSSVNAVGYNPATMMINNAPQPVEVTGAPFGLNGSQIVTAGVTVQSPAPFWVYSTLKIITVPAVTDKNGHVICATTSIATSTMVEVDGRPPVTTTLSWARPWETTPPSGIFTISGVNSNAEAYFGGSSIRQRVPTNFPVGITSIPATTISYDPNVPPSTASAHLTPIYNYTVVVLDSAGSIVTPLKPTGIVITFPTPFIYLPSRTETSGAVNICEETGGNENYGYVPQTVLDYMTAIPAISSQYPGLADCLPGGPSILHILECAFAEPTTQGLAPDLTTSTVITVSGGGFFSSRPVAPTVSAGLTPSQTPQATSLVALSPVSKPSPSQQSSAPSPPSPWSTDPLTSTLTSKGSIGPASTPIGSSILAASSQSAPAGSSAQPGTAASPPVFSSVLVVPDSSLPGSPASSMAAASDNPSSAPTATPSLVLAPPMPSSGSVVVIPGTVTIPVDPTLPLVVGSTMTIGGSTFVIVPTVSGIPLPGSITISSGQTYIVMSSPTTILVNPQVSIQGSTTTISGALFVIATGPTTIAFPTNTAPPVMMPGSTIINSASPVVIISTPATTPVISGVTISGSTTVIGGSTTVFTTGTASGKTSVVGGTTAVVVSGTQSVTLSANHATSTLVQVAGGASTLVGKHGWWLTGSFGILYAAMF